MKKWLLVLALLLLGTSACHQISVSVDSKGGESTSISSAVSLPSSSETEQASAMSIYTDWSKLSPKVVEANVYERWYQEYTNGLIPLDGGYQTPLIPYVGVQFSIEEEYSWEVLANAYYGLSTLDGKLVTDAVFSDIYFPYASQSGKTLPLLILSTIKDREMFVSVAAIDGSWCTEPLSMIVRSANSFCVFLAGRNGCKLVYLDGTQMDYSWEDLGFHRDSIPGWGMSAHPHGFREITENLLFLEETNNGWQVLDLQTNLIRFATAEESIQEEANWLGGTPSLVHFYENNVIHYYFSEENGWDVSWHPLSEEQNEKDSIYALVKIADLDSFRLEDVEKLRAENILIQENNGKKAEIQSLSGEIIFRYKVMNSAMEDE